MESTDYDPGDLVLFNGIALIYQTVPSSGELARENVGLVIKKVDFDDKVPDGDNCQQVIDSEIVIQEPKYVYTLLCKGAIIEVLDIDVNQLA